MHFKGSRSCTVGGCLVAFAACHHKGKGDFVVPTAVIGFAGKI